MVFTNRIAAIKAVRAIGFNARLEVNQSEGGVTAILHKDHLCLKDAKDLVEAIMELGYQQALCEGARRLRELEAAGAPETEHEARLRYLAQRQANEAAAAFDDIEF